MTRRIFHGIPLEKRCITSISSGIDIFCYKHITLQKDKCQYTYTSESGVILSSSGNLCSSNRLALSFPILTISCDQRSLEMLYNERTNEVSHRWTEDEGMPKNSTGSIKGET